MNYNNKNGTGVQKTVTDGNQTRLKHDGEKKTRRENDGTPFSPTEAIRGETRWKKTPPTGTPVMTRKTHYRWITPSPKGKPVTRGKKPLHAEKLATEGKKTIPTRKPGTCRKKCQRRKKKDTGGKKKRYRRNETLQTEKNQYNSSILA